MKKRCLFFSFLIMLLILPSCNSSINQPTEGHQSAEAMPVLRIRSIEAFERFVESPNLSSEDFDELLSSTAIITSSVRSQNKVNKVLSPLLSVGYPLIENNDMVQTFDFVYYDFDQRYDFFYIIDDIIYLLEYTKYETKTDRSNMTPACTLELDGHPISLYLMNDRLVGEIYKNGYKIGVVVRSYTDIEQISFEPFNLVQQNNEDPIMQFYSGS